MAAIKQYVNLDEDMAGEKGDGSTFGFGNKLKLKATIKAKGLFTSTRYATWEVVPGTQGAGAEKNVDKKYLAKANRAAVASAETKEKSNAFENELTLPYVGKDSYTLKAKKKAKKVSDQTVVLSKEYETWRLFYYTVHYMNDDCKNIYDAVKDRLQSAFASSGIELREKAVEAMDNEFQASESWQDNYDMKQHYASDTPPALDPKPSDCPFHLKILFVNDIADLEEKDLSYKCDKTTATDGSKVMWAIDEDAGSRPVVKGKVLRSAVNSPSRLTEPLVTAAKSPSTGDTWTIEDSGTLTKGNLAVVANDKIVWAGSGWAKLADKGSADVAGVNGKTPSKGDQYKITDSGTLTKGNLGVTANKVVFYDGSAWKLVADADKAKAWVNELNDPTKRPSSLNDEAIKALKTPSEGDAWTVNSDGTIKRGNLEVKKGATIVWKTDKFVLHTGKWWLHVERGPNFSELEAKRFPGTVKVKPAGGSDVDVKAKLTMVNLKEAKVPLHEFADLNDAVERGLELTFTAKANFQKGGCCGYSIGNLVVVRIKEEPSRQESAILQTFTHEVGHGLQQAAVEWALHDGDGAATGAKDPNPMYYTDDHGGQGPHCKTNAKEVSSQVFESDGTTPKLDDSGDPIYRTSSQKTYEWDSTKGDLCTLFHRDDAKVQVDGQFCEACVKGLRLANFDEASMRSAYWDGFE